MKLILKYFFVYLIISSFLFCKKENGKEKVEINVLKTELLEEKIKTKKENIYQITDSLIYHFYGKKLNYVDFNKNSKNKPKHIDFFEKEGIVKMKGILSKNFSGNYETSAFQNYTLFLFEYKTEFFAKKSFKKLTEDNESIITLIKNNEWLNPNDNKKNPEKDRIMTFSVHCKSGGFIFRKNEFLISLVETCSEPLTKGKMNWKEYENEFLKGYRVFERKEFLNTDCGSRNYYYEN